MRSLGRTKGLAKDEKGLMPRLWWMVGDDGWPESQARRSSSVNGAFPAAGEWSGGDAVGRNRPDSPK